MLLLFSVSAIWFMLVGQVEQEMQSWGNPLFVVPSGVQFTSMPMVKPLKRAAGLHHVPGDLTSTVSLPLG